MTNWHPTDEDLILHFYDEGGADEAHRIVEHLHDCAACRAVWAELGETFKLVDRAGMPEPGPGFERVMWARVQQALPAPRRAAWSIHVVLPIAATVTVCVLAGAYAWRVMHPSSAPAATKTGAPGGTLAAVATTTKPDSALGERVLLSALDDHFQQAQTLLVELNNAPEDADDFTFERTSADELVSSGRLYRVAARQRGERQFVQMLEDLEGVLLDVARTENGLRPEALQALRARIESQDLLFKVRVATKQVHKRQKDLMTTAAAANE